MTRVFLFGTLRDAALRRTVLGVEVPVRRVGLAGFTIHAANGAAALLPSAGNAEGLLAEPLPPAALDRLSWYAAIIGCEPRDVEIGGRPARLWTSRSAAAEPWDFDAWSARSAEIARAAASEAMEHYPAREPQWVRRRWTMIRTRAASQVAARRSPAPVLERSGLGAADVEVMAERRPYTDFFSVVEQDLRFRRFNGEMSRLVTRAALIGGDAVTVLPYDPVGDAVLLIEQFRFGPWARGDPLPWVLEPVAGRIDAGESPEDTARREALEEAGVALVGLERVASFYSSTGVLSEFVHAFVGLCDLSRFAPGIGGAEAEDEDILGRVLSYARLMELVEAGEAQDAPLLVTAWWLAANRHRLRS